MIECDLWTGDLIKTYQQCGDGWVQRKGSNSCYYWETDNLQSYAGALQECNLMNADLLVINDDNEQVIYSTDISLKPRLYG